MKIYNLMFEDSFTDLAVFPYKNREDALSHAFDIIKDADEWSEDNHPQIFLAVMDNDKEAAYNLWAKQIHWAFWTLKIEEIEIIEKYEGLPDL